jgi:hypothetical protein
MIKNILTCLIFLAAQICFGKSFSVGVGRDVIDYYEFNEKILDKEKVYSLIYKSGDEVKRYRIITEKFFNENFQEFNRLLPRKKWLDGEFKFLCENQIFLHSGKKQGAICLDGKKQLSLDFAAFFKELEQISSL